MKIDYRIVDGPRGGLTFDFVPCDHAFSGEYDHDRHGPHVFNISEGAFLFIEKAVAAHFPEWEARFHHFGVTWVSREIWLEILDSFSLLGADLRSGIDADAVVRKHVLSPGFLKLKEEQLIPQKYFWGGYRVNRKALLRFLDGFESRVRSVLERYPYLVIQGI